MLDYKYRISYCRDGLNTPNCERKYDEYIWSHWSASWSEKMNKLDEHYHDHCIFTGGIGGGLCGSLYLLSKNEILDLIEANKDWFDDFNCDELLKTEYYYLVVEDWS